MKSYLKKTQSNLTKAQEKSKATSEYLSSIGGKYSAARVTTEDRIACLHKEARNSIEESSHASSTYSQNKCTIQWDSAARKGQTEQIMTLDEVTMLWYLEDHQKMEDWSAPMAASILYPLNSNN